MGEEKVGLEVLGNSVSVRCKNLRYGEQRRKGKGKIRKQKSGSRSVNNFCSVRSGELTDVLGHVQLREISQE